MFSCCQVFFTQKFSNQAEMVGCVEQSSISFAFHMGQFFNKKVTFVGVMHCYSSPKHYIVNKWIIMAAR
jgi:hypothetical protein